MNLNRNILRKFRKNTIVVMLDILLNLPFSGCKAIDEVIPDHYMMV